jgi:SAM-dependent methyltransferase
MPAMGGADFQADPFEDLYAGAGDDLGSLPWVALAPQPQLVAWLDAHPPATQDAALVVGCGYGDDAAALARRGWATTAFDVAPTAIAHARRRFDGEPIEFAVADVFDLPSAWTQAFALVIEIRTLQSLPPDERAGAMTAIAATVAPGGRAWVRCEAREDSEPVERRPWPLSRRELQAFIAAGLEERSFQEGTSERGRVFNVIYERAVAGP